MAAEQGGSEFGIEHLDVEDLLALAEQLFGFPPSVRDLGLLGSVAARPSTSAFRSEAYPDIWLKAAALLSSLVKNHALVDGNRRPGWLATAVFLRFNGVQPTRASNNDVYDVVMEVAAGQQFIAESADGLRRIVGQASQRTKYIAKPEHRVILPITKRSRLQGREPPARLRRTPIVNRAHLSPQREVCHSGEQ